MFYGKERIRYLSRVKAVGSNWVEFERPLPYDVRLKWKVRSAGTGEREGGASWQNSVGILAGRYGRSLPTRQAAIPTACTAAPQPPSSVVALPLQPVLHRFAPRVSGSGFENFEVKFKWSEWLQRCRCCDDCRFALQFGFRGVHPLAPH